MFTATRPTVQKGYLPFNAAYFARLPYAEDFNINCGLVTSGLAVVYENYRAHSLYDPSYTFGGGQPYTYDQLALFYGWYRVDKVRIQVTFYNPTLDGMWVGVRCRSSIEAATSGLSIYDIRERPNTVIKQINDTGSQKVSLDFTVNIWDFFGMSRSRYMDDGSFEAATSGNPGYGYTPLIEPFAAITTAVDGNIRCSIKLTFHAKLFNRLSYSDS